jgi:hypothetical protein
MKKFMVHCSTAKSYWVTIEAPSKEAVSCWYDNSCEESVWLSGEEYGWHFHEIEELQPWAQIRGDIIVDSSGEQTDD